MCFFPWVGAVIGALTYAVYSLKEWMHQAGFGFPDFFFTALLVLIPVWVTEGFIWMAIWILRMPFIPTNPGSGRLEILKDPHTGAFAVIAGICYFVLDLGIYSGLTAESVRVIAAGFVLSRALSGLFRRLLSPGKKEGNGSGFLRWSEEEGKPTCADSLCDPGRCRVMIFAGGVPGVAAVLAAGVYSSIMRG